MINLNKKIRLDIIQADILDCDDIITTHIKSLLQKTLAEILKKIQNKNFKTEYVDPQKFLWITISEGFSVAYIDHIIYKVFTHIIYPKIIDTYNKEQIESIRDYYNSNKIQYFKDIAKTLEKYLCVYIDNKFINITFCQKTFRRIDTIRFNINIGYKSNL